MDDTYLDMWKEVEEEFGVDDPTELLTVDKVRNERKKIVITPERMKDIVKRGASDVIEEDLVPIATALLEAGLLSPDLKHRQFCMKEILDRASGLSKKVEKGNVINLNVSGENLGNALTGLKNLMGNVEVIDVGKD